MARLARVKQLRSFSLPSLLRSAINTHARTITHATPTQSLLVSCGGYIYTSRLRFDHPTLRSTCFGPLHCGLINKQIPCVPKKKLWSQTLAITLSNLNRFQKFLHCCKEKEISNKPCIIIPPHLRYVATLPCGIQQFETDTNYTQNTIKCPHI